MRIYTRDQHRLVIVLGLLVLFVSGVKPFRAWLSSLGSSEGQVANVKPSRTWVIEMGGAVKNPGIYTFGDPPTGYQAIERAGGLMDNHPLASDMFPQTLDSGTLVEVKHSKHQPLQLIVSPMTSTKRLVLGVPIKLNRATVEDLVILPRMSKVLAQRIIDFRHSQGPYKSWDDLRRVKGVGPKNIRHFSSYLEVE
jgi:competence protein ComEA